jgi:hypothetical protein
MKSGSGNFFIRAMLPLAVGVFFSIGSALAGEPPSVKSAIEGRAADYQRQDPGVPVWPSTCDCISVDFGFKGARGYRPVRFSIGDASRYYAQDVNVQLDARRARVAAKGPRKTLVADEVAEVSAKEEADQ